MDDQEFLTYLQKKLPLLKNKKLKIEKNIVKIREEERLQSQEKKDISSSQKSELIDLKNLMNEMRSNLKRDFRKIFIISGDSSFRKSVSNREKELINLVKLVCMSNGNFELIMNKIENLVETQEHSYYN